jgi:hypothetical protein
MFTIEPILVTMFKASSPISSKHMFLWYSLLEPHQITNHSNVGVMIRKVIVCRLTTLIFVANYGSWKLSWWTLSPYTQNSSKGHVLRLAEFWQYFGERPLLHNLLNGVNMSITLIRFSCPYSCIKCQHHEEHAQNEEYILRQVALLWTLPTSHTIFWLLEHVMIGFIMVNNVKHKEVYHSKN